jgi:hypothetical protein
MENTLGNEKPTENKNPNTKQFDEAFEQLAQFLFEQYRKQRECIGLNGSVTLENDTNLITEE